MTDHKSCALTDRRWFTSFQSPAENIAYRRVYGGCVLRSQSVITVLCGCYIDDGGEFSAHAAEVLIPRKVKAGGLTWPHPPTAVVQSSSSQPQPNRAKPNPSWTMPELTSPLQTPNTRLFRFVNEDRATPLFVRSGVILRITLRHADRGSRFVDQMAFRMDRNNAFSYFIISKMSIARKDREEES